MAYSSYDEAVTTGGNLRKGYSKSVNKFGQVFYYKKSDKEKIQPKKKDKPVFKVENVITTITFD